MDIFILTLILLVVLFIVSMYGTIDAIMNTKLYMDNKFMRNYFLSYVFLFSCVALISLTSFISILILNLNYE